jgi:hypothetical protein
VPKPTYVLNSDGRRELKHLVKKVCKKPRRSEESWIWSRSDVGRKCSLSRGSVEKVLQAVDPGKSYDSEFYLEECGGLSPKHPPVEEDIMIALFEGLYLSMGKSLAEHFGESLESFRGKADEEKKYLRKLIDSCLGRQVYWTEFKPEPDGRRTPKQTAELLRWLDAAAQREEFRLAIAGQLPLVVGVSVPCVGSQRWLIDCLINTPKYLEKRHWLKIQVSEHPVRFDPTNLIGALCGKLNCKSEEVLWQKLKQANRPLIISLYDFGQASDVTPEDVVREFWVPLREKLEQQKVSSQIILLMADYNLASDSLVESLTPLSSISQDDVKGWMIDKLDDRDRVDRLLASDFSWRWGQPGHVLNRVCKDLLGLGNGMVDLYKTWECS